MSIKIFKKLELFVTERFVSDGVFSLNCFNCFGAQHLFRRNLRTTTVMSLKKCCWAELIWNAHVNVFSGAQHQFTTKVRKIFICCWNLWLIASFMLSADIEMATSKSFDILMNHFKAFINFHARHDLVELHSATYE